MDMQKSKLFRLTKNLLAGINKTGEAAIRLRTL
ncbi:hypothetical protein BSNT_10546 [Bacillus subtilis subsp. natto BEST195]|nr:hypothetical protein BSNT_10546 [Bacillus subtilis subsp. natto BEST195]